MTGNLLDVNVLLALAWPNHQFHSAATAWFRDASAATWCTCSLTELSFVRLSSNPRFTAHAHTPLEATRLLQRLRRVGAHCFLEATLSCASAEFEAVIERAYGAKQVTDAYLIALAQQHGVRFVTFDRRLVALAHSLDQVLVLGG